MFVRSASGIHVAVKTSIDAPEKLSRHAATPIGTHTSAVK
jgi:hypothetical protein